jgi:hypothetical protein
VGRGEGAVGNRRRDAVPTHPAAHRQVFVGDPDGPPPSSVLVPDQNSPADADNRMPSARARFGMTPAATVRKV